LALLDQFDPDACVGNCVFWRSIVAWLRLLDLDDQLVALDLRGALRFRIGIAVDEGFGDEGKILAVAVLERRRLLVGQPRDVPRADIA
jgi:hypothetical protein